MPPLANPKHELYAQGRSTGLSKIQAYVAAGFKANASGATKLDKKPDVQARIAELVAAAAAKFDLTRENVMEELARIVYGDLGTFLRLQEDGTAIFDLKDAPPEATKILQEITTETYLEGAGKDAKVVKRIKFKLYSKLDAIKLAANILRLSQAEDEKPNDYIPLADRLKAYRQEEAVAASDGKVVSIR